MSYFHSFTERLEAVKEIKSGYPVSVYCKEHGYGRDQVLECNLWAKLLRNLRFQKDKIWNLWAKNIESYLENYKY